MRATAILMVIVLAVCNADADVLFEKVLFQQGDNGYHTYRIPALYETQSGVLLAFAEARRNSPSDTGDIDVVLRRSVDGGHTWTDMQIVWSDGANTCGNPTVVQDRSTGRIWLFLTHNLGHDTQRQIQDGTSDGIRTIWSCYSDDDGQTWSEPVNRFEEVQPSNTRWDATGPGRGIQLKSGNNPGRLIIPALGRNIQSDDHGQSWYQSSWLMQGSPHPQAGNSESQIVEVQGGVLLRNDRRVGGPGGRLFTRSFNQGATWASSEYRLDLPCPRSMGSTIAVDTNKGIFGRKLVFSNPSHDDEPGSSGSQHRYNMAVQYSYNDGRNWPVRKVVFPGYSAYSCLSAIGDDHFGLLYENGDSPDNSTELYRRMTFAKFSREWIYQKSLLSWNFEDFSVGETLPTDYGAIKDKRGYGLDATAQWPFEVISGGINYAGNSAVRFTGNGKGIRFSDSYNSGRLDFGVNDSFTIRVLFRTTDHYDGGPGGSGALVSKDVGANQPSWWLRVQDGRVRFFIDDGSDTASVWSSVDVTDGRWRELVASRDADSGKLYLLLDGRKVGQSEDNTTGSLSNTNDVVVGCFNDGSRSFAGDIGRVTITRGNLADIVLLQDGDLNQDGVIDIEDLAIMTENWLSSNN